MGFIKELIENIKYTLTNNNYFECSKVYIRGSFAKGEDKEESDLDLLVVSDDFEGVDVITRRRLVCKALFNVAEREIDAICLSKTEFKRLCFGQSIDIICKGMLGVIE